MSSCLTAIKAAREAAKVRQEVVSGLDELERTLPDIESYLAIFPNDNNIINASVDLVVATLKAIEDLIGYYTRHLGELQNPPRPSPPTYL